MSFVGKGTITTVDKLDDLLDEGTLHHAGHRGDIHGRRSLIHPGTFARSSIKLSISIGHHHDTWRNLPRAYHSVKDLTSTATIDPGSLVASRTMKEVEDRELNIGRLIVLRREVDGHAPLGHTIERRRVPHIFEAAMIQLGMIDEKGGDGILDDEIVPHHIDIAHPSFVVRIEHWLLIDQEPVGIEFGSKRWDSEHPAAVRLLHGNWLFQERTCKLNSSSLWRTKREGDRSVRMHHHAGSLQDSRQKKSSEEQEKAMQWNTDEKLEMKAEAEGDIVGFTFVAQIVVLLLEVTGEQEEAETG